MAPVGQAAAQVPQDSQFVLFQSLPKGARIVVRRPALPETSVWFPAAVLKLAASVLRAAEAVLRAVQAVLGDDELKRRAAGPVDRFRTGLHDHAGVRERIAGGDEPAHAFDLHHAEAAGADIAHVLQVAEGRDVNAGGTRRIKERCALFDRDRAAVHRNVKHTESSRPRQHPRRSSRSAGSGCIPERLLPCSSRARRP